MEDNIAHKNIPQGWKQVALGDVVSITTGSRDANHGSLDGQYPFFTCAQKVLKIDDFSFDTEAVLIAGNGDFNVKYYKGKFDAYQRTYVLDAFKNTTGPFIYQKTKQALNDIMKNNQGSSVKFIKMGDLTNYKFILPPIKEQQKIAEILGAMDEDITKTQGVIEATEKLKKGLMQQLFTRGIGHTKFKKTKLGEIPEEWEIISLQEMIDNGIVVSHLDGNHGELYPKTSEFIDDGVPYLSANCIEDGNVNFHKAKYLSSERASKFIKGVAMDGDILFAHNATVGPVAILKTKEKYVILSTTLTYYRCNEDKLVTEYVRYYMESDLFSDQYKRVMAQSTRNQVPITMQRTFLHVLPIYKEQQKIAEILSAVDEKISINKKLKNKLTLLKKGLMQDLLSGKMRV